MCCSVLQCVAVGCNELPCVAVCCRELQSGSVVRGAGGSDSQKASCY